MRSLAAGLPRTLVDLPRRVRELWRRVRAWRRMRFTAAGLVFSIGSGAVGFAAVNTGNNLLYLLLGAMLGFIAVSGWASERMIRDLEVVREPPRGATVGQEMRISYRVRNRRRRLPALALEISEQGLAGKAFVPRIEAQGTTGARSLQTFVRRGIYPLDAVTLSTGFPFGFFLKERDVSLSGELVIWPRADRPVRLPAPPGGPARAPALSAAAAPGARGDYRSLNDYRPGDDARDIHWKTSARLSAPVVREYERDAGEDVWICLDTRGAPGDDAERLVEIAASLAAAAAREGRTFALTAGGALAPGSGPGHLERALDLLARVDFRADAPPPAPPVERARCVLVSLHPQGGDGFAAVHSA